MVELEDVKGKGKEEPLHVDITFPASKEATEMHILFSHGKGTLRLNGAVDAEQTAYIGGDAPLHFFPLAQEIFVNVGSTPQPTK